MYFVYILRSRNSGYIYTGLTKDISRRLREHNSGQVKPTKAHIPLEIVYTESFTNRKQARAREKFFKTGSGRDLRNIILNNK